MSTPLDTQLQQIGQVQPHLPGVVSVLLGLLAGVIGAVPLAWALVRHVDTIAHEGAHAIMASSLGHKIGGIEVKRNGDGGTRVPTVRSRGAGVAIGAVGYLGPSAFGLGAAWLISAGHIEAVLWLGLALLVMLLPLTRGWFAVTAVAATGFALYWVATRATLTEQTVSAYGVAWLLLVSGVRTVLEHGRGARDAGILRDLSLLPRGFWSAIWLAATAAALAFGGRLLV